MLNTSNVKTYCFENKNNRFKHKNIIGCGMSLFL